MLASAFIVTIDPSLQSSAEEEDLRAGMIEAGFETSVVSDDDHRYRLPRWTFNIYASPTTGAAEIRDRVASVLQACDDDVYFTVNRYVEGCFRLARRA